MTAPSIAVIGGGIAGLCAARALAAAGAQVQLYEASDRVGGVIRSSRQDGWLHEHAANAFLPGAAQALAGELGVPVDEAGAAARRRWIWVRGALRAVPTNPVALATSDLLSWRGKLSALLEPLRPARRDGADETIDEFARRRLGAEVADTLVAPFVTGVFGGESAQLSLAAAFPRVAALAARGGLVRGLVGQALAARRAGTRRPRGRLAAPRGGVEALTAALAADLGPVVRTGAAVTALEPRPGGLIVHRGGGARDEVAAAVLATPAYAAAPLCAPLSAELAALLAAIPYAPIAVVYLGYRTADLAHALDGFGFLVAPGEALRLLGCVFESVLWPDRAPPGHHLLRCIFAGTRDPGAAALDDAALLALARHDLAASLGVSAAPVHTTVVRQPRAIAQYTVGHAARVARAEQLAEPCRLVLAGASYHGVAVNDCVVDGARAARAALDRAT